MWTALKPLGRNQRCTKGYGTYRSVTQVICDMSGIDYPKEKKGPKNRWRSGMSAISHPHNFPHKTEVKSGIRTSCPKKQR